MRNSEIRQLTNQVKKLVNNISCVTYNNQEQLELLQIQADALNWQQKIKDYESARDEQNRIMIALKNIRPRDLTIEEEKTYWDIWESLNPGIYY